MIYIRNDSQNPFYNLALEEYVFTELDAGNEYLMLWQNEPSIIIGRNQNTIKEINQSFVEANNINVVRRITGGGAVYHDLGNLNFTFITRSKNEIKLNFEKFARPIIDVLRSLGVAAEFNSRNDIVIGGKKFSGNAQYLKNGRVLHHGTLLFDSDLAAIEKALSVSEDKIISKGIQSVRSRVTNIREHLKEDVSLTDFKELLIKHLCSEDSGKAYYSINNTDERKVKELMQKKYLKWEWNYGRSPKFNIKNSKRFDSGKIEVLLNISEGIIRDCKFYGDFFGFKDVADLEQILEGNKYRKDDLQSVLADSNIESYFGNITVEELLGCIFV